MWFAGLLRSGHMKDGGVLHSSFVQRFVILCVICNKYGVYHLAPESQWLAACNHNVARCTTSHGWAFRWWHKVLKICPV